MAEVVVLFYRDYLKLRVLLFLRQVVPSFICVPAPVVDSSLCLLTLYVVPQQMRYTTHVVRASYYLFVICIPNWYTNNKINSEFQVLALHSGLHAIVCCLYFVVVVVVVVVSSSVLVRGKNSLVSIEKGRRILETWSKLASAAQPHPQLH